MASHRVHQIVAIRARVKVEHRVQRENLEMIVMRRIALRRPRCPSDLAIHPRNGSGNALRYPLAREPMKFAAASKARNKRAAKSTEVVIETPKGSRNKLAYEPRKR